MDIKLHWHREAIERGEDGHAGAQMLQLTSAPICSHNIYCEERYGTADGRLFAILRSPTGRQPNELWLCDMHGRQVALVSTKIFGFPSAPVGSDNLYFIEQRDDRRVLCRLDLTTMVQDELTDVSDCPSNASLTCIVSPDERVMVGNLRVDRHTWGLYRVDIASGKWEVFHEHRDICNSHIQFEPARGEDILVQLNRGCDIDEEGNRIRLVGDEGATLYLIDKDGGNIRYLPVGKPHTGEVSGHECWIGSTGRILLSTCEEDRNDLHVVTPGDPTSRLLWRGIGKSLAFMHVAASSDGNYFVCDDIVNGRIYVGRFDTGRMLPLCDSGASCGAPQYTHPHPYMTPDNRYVIFNSDQTGVPQVWAAVLPDGFLDALDVGVG